MQLEAPLSASDDIRLLGRLLGEVIAEQAGPDTLALIEEIRQAATGERRGTGAPGTLVSLLEGCGDDRGPPRGPSLQLLLLPRQPGRGRRRQPAGPGGGGRGSGVRPRHAAPRPDPPGRPRPGGGATCRRDVGRPGAHRPPDPGAAPDVARPRPGDHPPPGRAGPGGLRRGGAPAVGSRPPRPDPRPVADGDPAGITPPGPRRDQRDAPLLRPDALRRDTSPAGQRGGRPGRRGRPAGAGHPDGLVDRGGPGRQPVRRRRRPVLRRRASRDRRLRSPSRQPAPPRHRAVDVGEPGPLQRRRRRAGRLVGGHVAVPVGGALPAGHERLLRPLGGDGQGGPRRGAGGRAARRAPALRDAGGAGRRPPGRRDVPRRPRRRHPGGGAGGPGAPRRRSLRVSPGVSRPAPELRGPRGRRRRAAGGGRGRARPISISTRRVAWRC